MSNAEIIHVGATNDKNHSNHSGILFICYENMMKLYLIRIGS